MNKITHISGPVVHATIPQASINDIVHVGKEELLGEIIEIREDTAIIQVYEDTTGLRPGDPITNTHQGLQVHLGPGLLGTVYDGTQRPLSALQDIFLPKTNTQPSLSHEKKWFFEPNIPQGTEVREGMIIGTVQEHSFTHKILVPPGVQGILDEIHTGEFTITQQIGRVGRTPLYLAHTQLVRKPRGYVKRLANKKPLITGQRVLDFTFPIAKGGSAATPGPFGAGKTVIQQQIAKWSDADIIVYIGCGERGNEMTEVLEEFPHIKDPRTGEPLMNRTVLIANTSNMPVAAREASIYTGITIAEYFRDQGYAVALMADSTSRWAEAMREISGRLEELPGEEGYPAYLAKRLAEFYERSGTVETYSGMVGSISVIGAVSPAGGDFSEPVTQQTLRLTKAFWALDASLANKRHYPSVNWLMSYTQFNLEKWFEQEMGPEWNELRQKTLRLLQEEKELLDIVSLVGVDSLSREQQITLFTARLVREDFLQQNAYSDIDTYCPLQKQLLIIQAIWAYDALLRESTKTMDEIRTNKATQLIGELKNTPNEEFTTNPTEKSKHIRKKLEEGLRT